MRKLHVFGVDWSIPVHIEIAKFAEKRLQPLITSA